GAGTGITAGTATLNASARPGGGMATGYFRYSTTSPGTCNDTFGTRAPATGGANLGAGNTSNPFSQPITGLVQGPTYYYCGCASNSAGTGLGGVSSFKTMTSPTVTTNAATSVTNLTATLQGSANPNGDASVGWFRFSTTNP